jgi:hypothetical protein
MAGIDSCSRHPFQARSPGVEEEVGIYRGEVTDIIGALADIKAGIIQIPSYIEGEDDEEEAEEDL